MEEVESKNIQPKKETKIKKKYKLSPTLIIALSFLALILIGSILLYCPFSHDLDVSYLDALFISISCSCVTGLTSLKESVGSTFNVYGYSIMGVLIQIGGLGVTTFAVVFFFLFNHRLNFGNQTLIKENWNLKNLKSIRAIFFQVLFVSLSFEAIGAFFTAIDLIYIHGYDFKEGIGLAIFHAVSAFNNAGFDIFKGNTNSLAIYEGDIFLNIITSLLVIFGGIGYFVIINVISNKFRFKKFSLHSKVAITYSLFFVVIGTILIYFGEFNNTNDITSLTPNGVTFSGAFFMSVSSRTAGFSMYDLSKYRDITLLFMILLMFVGASPGSAGGGAKTTTFALLLAYLRGIITNRRPYLFKRSIDDGLVRRALLILLLGVFFFVFGIVTISCFESGYNFVNVLTGEKSFEYKDGYTRFATLDYAFIAMSAFATVGLATAPTWVYSIGSKCVLMFLMYVGRIGPLAISTLFRSQQVEKWHYGYEDLSIG